MTTEKKMREVIKKAGYSAEQSRIDPLFFLDTRTVSRNAQLDWYEKKRKEMGDNADFYCYVAIHNHIEAVPIPQNNI